jgi:hypothetical protein
MRINIEKSFMTRTPVLQLIASRMQQLSKQPESTGSVFWAARFFVLGSE